MVSCCRHKLDACMKMLINTGCMRRVVVAVMFLPTDHKATAVAQ
jgi:hypothetical protein